MKSIFAVVVICFGSIICAFGQESAPTVSTSVMESAAQYEIFRPRDLQATFRLNRFTGRIHRLATCPRDDSEGSRFCWKEMTILEPPKYTSEGRPRFQMYSDASAHLFFLIDTVSGKTWQLGVDSQDRWQPFLDCSDRTSFTCQWRP